MEAILRFSAAFSLLMVAGAVVGRYLPDAKEPRPSAEQTITQLEAEVTRLEAERERLLDRIAELEK